MAVAYELWYYFYNVHLKVNLMLTDNMNDYQSLSFSGYDISPKLKKHYPGIAFFPLVLVSPYLTVFLKIFLENIIPH